MDNNVKVFFKLLFVVLSLLQCKKVESQTINEINKNSERIVKKTENEKYDCYDLVKKIVESSNVELKTYKNNYTINIENIKSDSINIHVYTENNLSDNPSQKQMVESTIAWLVFLPNEQKLLNITADPIYPIELKFDKNILKNNDIFKICQISKQKDKTTITTDNKERDCKKISGETMSGEECIIKNTRIENMYNSIIKEKFVDDSEYLLKTMPKTDYNSKINKNGLISIQYKTSNNKLVIEMLYDGGSTDITIEQIEQNVKRIILYNAD